MMYDRDAKTTIHVSTSISVASGPGFEIAELDSENSLLSFTSSFSCVTVGGCCNSSFSSPGRLFSPFLGVELVDPGALSPPPPSVNPPSPYETPGDTAPMPPGVEGDDHDEACPVCGDEKSYPLPPSLAAGVAGPEGMRNGWCAWDSGWSCCCWRCTPTTRRRSTHLGSE